MSLSSCGSRCHWASAFVPRGKLYTEFEKVKMSHVKLESRRLRIWEMMASESDSWDGGSGKMRSFKLLNMFITYIAFYNPKSPSFDGNYQLL